MILLNPIWLLLAIPLAISLWLIKAPSRFLHAVRIIIITLVILAMVGPAIKLPSRRGTVVVIADRSCSMPVDADARQKEIIDLLQSEIPSGNNLAVISYGQKAVLEHPPQTGKFAGFIADVGQNASNMAQAIQLAVSMIGQERPGRILVISDGKWTGNDPSAVTDISTADVPVDYRLFQRSGQNDLAVYRVDVPDVVRPGESYMLNVWIQSPLQQEVDFQLNRGSSILGQGKKIVPSGLTRLTFRDRAGRPGSIRYRFTVSSGSDDPIPENNTADMLVGVEGQKPVLCVSRSPDSGLGKLLQSGLLNIQTAPPNTCKWDLDDLSNYSAVIIEDVPADKIGTSGMQNIAAWIEETGAGFMMTGGKNAYGPGGYFKSPLEAIMPVSMELRKEHRKLALAIVIALDRSGSMAASVAGGKTKMDLANVASVQVLEMLSAMDEFGVIAVDSQAHVVVDLVSAEKKNYYRTNILSIQSMGGGIFVYEALSNAASMLAKATPETRHIILFADAADSEEPGKYIELLEKCSQAGITVSVIGLGTDSDIDAGLLKDIARRGQGRCFFTNSPEELPRLFAQDTLIVARNSFIEENTPVKTSAGLRTLTGRAFDIPKSIGGYNLCYIRPNANLAAVTTDDYKAPVVSSWFAGIGRVLCYTGQANGPFTGEIAGWEQVGSFFTSLARWVAGEAADLGPGMLLTQQLRSGNCLIQLHLDPEREGEPLNELPKVTTLHGMAGRPPDSLETTMQYVDADTLSAEIPMVGAETALSTVEIQGFSPVTLPPVTLPYCLEYQPVDISDAEESLKRLAKVTGGIERLDVSDIWNDLPTQPRLTSLSPWLLITAVVCLLLEVLERRTGVLTGNLRTLFLNIIKWRPVRIKYIAKKSHKRVKKQKVVRAVEKPPKKPAEHVSVKQETPSKDGLLSALSKARKSARARTDKKRKE